LKTVLKVLDPIGDFVLLVGFIVCLYNIFATIVAFPNGAPFAAAGWALGLFACLTAECWLIARHIRSQPQNPPGGLI
jgi:hypothetical protein